MSMIFQNDSTGVIAPGTPIVLLSGKAVPYSDLVHSLDQIVGVSYPTSRTNGRAFSIPNGQLFLENDIVLWNEDMTYEVDSEDNQVLNESYYPINPYSATDSWTTCVYIGLVPVLVEFDTLPSSWNLIATKTLYNWYFIR